MDTDEQNLPTPLTDNSVEQQAEIHSVSEAPPSDSPQPKEMSSSENKTTTENPSEQQVEQNSTNKTSPSSPTSTEPQPIEVDISDDKATENVSSTEKTTTGGLSLLSAYNSDCEGVVDSDVEEVQSVVEVPVVVNTEQQQQQQHHRKQVVEVSSSSSDDSSSSSESDSEGEYLTVLRKEIDKKIRTEDCDDDDVDEDEDADGAAPRRRQQPKVRGEMLLEDLPPIEQLEITVPEDECIELGKVQSIVDQLVLVSVLPNSMLFDLDTVLFLEKGRKVLGQVFDVLGQVADPLYCVRFNSNQHIKDCGINVGDVVYCAPKTEHTQFVILSKLTQVRGSDASWEHDVEPPARFIDYSDDEAEREARSDRRKKRQRDRTNSTDSTDQSETASVSTAPAVVPRQRGRRGQREQRHSYAGRPHYQQQQQGSHQQQQHHQHPQGPGPGPGPSGNYHPSYNPGSWHSNYYPNYHHPAAAAAGYPAFPMPSYGYGYGPAVPMVPMPPHHMYPPPYGHPPPPHPPPPSGGS